MKFLKTIMIATLGFGVPMVAIMVASPIEAAASWWKKLLGIIIEGIGDWISQYGRNLQLMRAGQSTSLPAPINISAIENEGAQYGITISGNNVSFKNNIDVYTNDEDGTIVAIKAGTYLIGDDGKANLVFVARAPK